MLIAAHQLREEETINFMSFKEISELGKKLNIRLSELFEKFEESDLNEGIRICIKCESYLRDNIKDGIKIYTYQHLVKTRSLPQMMAIRCIVHNNDLSNFELNDGHKYQMKVTLYTLHQAQSIASLL